MTRKQKLHSIWEIVNEELGEFITTSCPIAGAAPRDTQLDLEPRDYDVFLLNNMDHETMKPIIQKKLQNFKDLKKENEETLKETKCSIHHSFVMDNIKILDSNIQIITHPAATLEGLLYSFDFTCCMFGYDGKEFVNLGDLNNIINGELKINRISYPFASLRRAFRISERFNMKISTSTINHLIMKCLEVNNKEDKDYII